MAEKLFWEKRKKVTPKPKQIEEKNILLKQKKKKKPKPVCSDRKRRKRNKKLHRIGRGWSGQKRKKGSPKGDRPVRRGGVTCGNRKKGKNELHRGGAWGPAHGKGGTSQGGRNAPEKGKELWKGTRNEHRCPFSREESRGRVSKGGKRPLREVSKPRKCLG